MTPTYWPSARRPHRSRRVAAAVLRVAGATLDRLALRLAAPVPPSAPPSPLRQSLFEFHAEAGAPEGALYVDGELVGYLSGVQRL